MKKRIIVWGIVCVFLATGLAPLGLAQTTVSGPSGTASANVPQFLEFSMKIVRKMDAATFDPTLSPFSQGTDVSASPSFDFGLLSKVTDTDPTSTTYGQFLYMRSQFFYYVLLMAATSGRRYMITESGTQLTGPGNAKIANESVLLVPDYQWQDKLGTVNQGAPPGAAYLGPVTAATSTGGSTQALVYQSDSNGLGRIVRAVVVIGGPAKGSSWPTNYTLGYNGTAPQGTPQLFDGSGPGGLKWKPVTTDQVSGGYTGTITFTLTTN